MKAELWIGDSGDILDELARGSIDAIVSDPPAGIGFQGHQWDKDKGGRDAWIGWLTGVLKKALKLLKPGGHCLLWALPRTSHWTATALEDAGFEIRDVVTHIQGQGFPKSITLAPGIGSALKPASEHWLLARRPPEGTLKATFERSGVGGLNIDATRVKSDTPAREQFFRADEGEGVAGLKAKGAGLFQPSAAGRWSPNFTISHSPDCVPVGCVDWCPVQELDAQAGERVSGSRRAGVRSGMGFNGARGDGGPAIESSKGSALRFFPVFFAPKPSRGQRETGCQELAPRSGSELTGRKEGSAGINNPRAGTGRSAVDVRNFHPTVKSVELMTWLVSLVTPVGGVVLDMFAGSGSTGVAAVQLGRGFVGIEADEAFAKIAEARINFALLSSSASG